MPSAQRNDEFSSEPWRVPNAERSRLLSRFLTADLATREWVDELRLRTGRAGIGGGGYPLPDGSIWLQHPDPAQRRDLAAMYEREGQRVTITTGLIPPEQEPGRHVPKGPLTSDAFTHYYRDVQATLQAAVRQHHQYLEDRRRRSARLALGGQGAILGAYLDDVRLSFVYRSVSAGPHGGTVHVLEEPLRGENRSLSLVGELALAAFHQFVEANESVECPSCHELAFFKDVRHREICSKPECRAWYRAKWARESYAAEKKTTARRKRR